MIEMLKKAMYTGVGMALLTKEKLEELGQDLVKQADLGEEQGKKFIDEMMSQSEKAREEFTTKVNSLVGESLSRMNLATRAEIDALKARIDELEKRQAPTSPSTPSA